MKNVNTKKSPDLSNNLNASDDRYNLLEAVQPTVIPNTDFEESYDVPVVIIWVVIGFFGRLLNRLKDSHLQKELPQMAEKHRNSEERRKASLGNLDNKLIGILIKYQQTNVNKQEIENSLRRECSLSESSINKILKNIRMRTIKMSKSKKTTEEKKNGRRKMSW